MVMSELTKKTILTLASAQERIDGRGLQDFRTPKITTGIIPNAQGSALVELGLTKVVAGIKVGIGTPYPDKQEEGVMATAAELTPIASPDFESGPPSPQTVELARVVDRVIRESETLDTKALCIKPKEKVWMVYLDMYPLDMDGNLIDAGVLACMAAMLTAKLPRYENETVIYDDLKDPLPVSLKPVSVTHGKIENTLLVDTTNTEEQVMSGRYTVGFKEDGTICAMQKGGIATFSPEEIETMLENAQVHAKFLRGFLP